MTAQFTCHNKMNKRWKQTSDIKTGIGNIFSWQDLWHCTLNTDDEKERQDELY